MGRTAGGGREADRRASSVGAAGSGCNEETPFVGCRTSRKRGGRWHKYNPYMALPLLATRLRHGPPRRTSPPTSCCSNGPRRRRGSAAVLPLGPTHPLARLLPASRRPARRPATRGPAVRPPRQRRGAVVHGDGDLTYGLTLPPGKPWQDGESWLCRFHHLLEAVFRGWAVPAKVVVCGEEAKLGPVLCFLDQTAGGPGGERDEGGRQRPAEDEGGPLAARHDPPDGEPICPRSARRSRDERRGASAEHAIEAVTAIRFGDEAGS